MLLVRCETFGDRFKSDDKPALVVNTRGITRLQITAACKIERFFVTAQRKQTSSV